jgi:hypothetical protein
MVVGPRKTQRTTVQRKTVIQVAQHANWMLQGVIDAHGEGLEGAIVLPKLGKTKSGYRCKAGAQPRPDGGDTQVARCPQSVHSPLAGRKGSMPAAARIIRQKCAIEACYMDVLFIVHRQ